MDLSRLISRAMRVPTGVDRVELAYLREFLTDRVPVQALVRTSYGFALLDRAGMTALLDRIEGRSPWGPADRLSRLRKELAPARQAAESDVRRLCIARCLPIGLTRMLAARVPRGAVYVNTGHSNLTDRVLTAVHVGAGARIAVMVHDVIPLDFPHYQRPGTDASFRLMLRRVAARADVILCNSADTAQRVTRAAQVWGHVPQTLVAHLGVDIPAPSGDWPQPVGFDPARPFFVTVGTIEPRKNHMFLLDLWQAMAAELAAEQMPQLLICGSRGWNNDAVFARLDDDPLMGRHVFELPGLPDGQIATILASAAGLLFPSHAEGYGLPPIEAASLGTPVVCNTLPVYREVLGDYPVYAKVDAIYPWQETIMALVAAKKAGRRGQPIEIPRWDAHFKTVLSKLG